MKPTRRSPGGRGCQAAHWGVLQSHYGENCQLEGAGLEPRANVYPTIAVLQRQEGIQFSRFLIESNVEFTASNFDDA